jgi:hypothetical protein
MSMTAPNGHHASRCRPLLAAALAACAAVGALVLSCGTAGCSAGGASPAGEESPATWRDTGLELRVKTALLQKRR